MTHDEKVRRRLIKGVLFGAIVSSALGTAVGPVKPVFVLACAVSGGLTSFVVTWREWGIPAAMTLFGGTGMLLSCLGIYWRWAEGNIGPQTLFFVWLLYLVFGALIGAWADTSRVDF
jgi:hypothetical protein